MRKNLSKFIHKGITGLILFCLVLTALVGCGGESANTRYLLNSQSSVTQILNWYPQPDHGGLYAAQMRQYFEQEGLNVKIQPGSPQVSSMQVVVSGRARFGLADASELLLARQEGLPVVAVAAFFQETPQALLFHKGQDINDFSDLNGRNVYVSPGAKYWEHIKKKYKLDGVQEFNYSGTFANFIADEKAVMQGYLTSEPFLLADQGIKTEWLSVADSGYAPYQEVLYTTEGFLRNNPDIVKKYVKAAVQGWQYYLKFPEVVNPHIQQINPDLKLKSMTAAAKASKHWVLRDEATTKGIGYMTEAKWAQTQKQLIDLGVLKQEVDLKKVFTTEYLPE